MPIRFGVMARRRSLVTETATGEWGEASAVFSRDRRHRYTLTRTWDPAGPVVNFLMLNPSTADAFALDPTNRRCVGFAQRWGFGALVTTNIFAFRSTDPKGLRGAPDPIGPDNDEVIIAAARSADLLVIAWGNHGSLHARGTEVLERLDHNAVTPHHLGRTRRGHPSHPLYLAGDLVAVPFA